MLLEERLHTFRNHYCCRYVRVGYRSSAGGNNDFITRSHIICSDGDAAGSDVGAIDFASGRSASASEVKAACLGGRRSGRCELSREAGTKEALPAARTWKEHE